MELQTEKINEEGQEKHLPVVVKQGNQYKIKVGTEAHPMETEHYIEWVELIVDGQLVVRKFLNPGETPGAVFCLAKEPQQLEVRAYCNLHNLWKVKF